MITDKADDQRRSETEIKIAYSSKLFIFKRRNVLLFISDVG